MQRPHLFVGLSRGARKPFDPAERAHGDGIAINLDSPEAFDEVFWRIFYGESYIRLDGLLPHSPGTHAIARYRDYIRLVLRRSGKRRYLSKDNNNILRLGTLAERMRDCTFLLVIREPRAHADSLLRQHRRSASSRDSFERDYLRWLAHHEFGADRRPFRLPGSPDGDPGSIDYWLATWLACYRTLEPVAEAHPNILVVPYERLCAGPKAWAAICERVGIKPTQPSEIRSDATAAPELEQGPLTVAADALYTRYLERCHFP